MRVIVGEACYECVSVYANNSDVVVKTKDGEVTTITFSSDDVAAVAVKVLLQTGTLDANKFN